MDAACQQMVEGMRFQSLSIYHFIAVMVLALAFYTKNPDGVGDVVNIFLLPDLSPLEGLEAALLMRHWDEVLGGGNLTSFEPDPRAEKGSTSRNLVRSGLPAQGLIHFLHGVSWGRDRSSCHIQYGKPCGGDDQRQLPTLGTKPAIDIILGRPTAPDLNRISQKVLSGAGETAAGAIARL